MSSSWWTWGSVSQWRVERGIVGHISVDRLLPGADALQGDYLFAAKDVARVIAAWPATDDMRGGRFDAVSAERVPRLAPSRHEP